MTIFLLGILLLNSTGRAECLVPSGDRIKAQDLAAVRPELAGLDTVIGPAPFPGARRNFSALELDRLANRLGRPPASSLPACVEWPLRSLQAEILLTALKNALGTEASRLELVEYTHAPVPAGQLEFTLSGLSTPPAIHPDDAVLWRGRLRYAERSELPVWARVRVSVLRRVVIAADELVAGRVIRQEQLRITEASQFPVGRLAKESIEGVVGRLPRRKIRAGEKVYAALLMDAPAIQRGDIVSIQVSAGAVQLRLDARSETAAWIGQKIALQNPENGRRFTAVVTGRGTAAVSAAKGKNDVDSNAAGGSDGDRIRSGQETQDAAR